LSDPNDESLPPPVVTDEPTIPGRPVLDVDNETTVDLTGADLSALLQQPARDDASSSEDVVEASKEAAVDVSRSHLKGLVEALVFVSDGPMKANEIARAASAKTNEVKTLLDELRSEYQARGVQLEEVAGGWVFRTNPQFSPFVRDLAKQKPVRLTRAQLETLAIMAYRQPITRPEIDDIRGVDSGATLKLLLERDLVRILGKKDEPGRPILYGTSGAFLELFGLKSLKDLPTLKEFTELNEESKRVVENELGDELDARQPDALEPPVATGPRPPVEDFEDPPHDTDAPPSVVESGEQPPTEREADAAPDTDPPSEDDVFAVTEPPRKPGAWELAAEGDEEEEEDEDDEDDDDDDDEDDDDDDDVEEEEKDEEKKDDKGE
jgi:segregation and condensation protein B